MNKQNVLATFVVAILAASLLSVVGLSVPLQKASAQTITTSADSHGGTFFGEGFVQVVVTDPNKDDDDTNEDITAEIDADPDLGASASASFIIRETSLSSSKFEFYLAHFSADDVAVGSLDTINSLGAAEHPVPGNQASVIRFGAGGDICPDCGLAEDASFDITVGSDTITIDYEEMAGLLSLDRSIYGSNNLMYIVINDQDANLDPTNGDSFNVTESDLNSLLFDINGAAFVDFVEFDETGDNTALFEGIVQLTDADSATGQELDVALESVQITLNESADYSPSADLAADTSTDTDDESFTIDDVDGTMTPIGAVTFASELKVTVNDNDGNVDSQDDDTLVDALIVESDGAGGDIVAVDLAETDDNTGIFLPDLTNDEIKITFVNSTAGVIAGNDILELSPDDVTSDIFVRYNDTNNDNGATELFENTIELTLSSPQLSLPETAGINDDFLLTVTDAQLNDNPRTKDSYTFTLDGTGEYDLFRGATNIGVFMTVEVDIEGEGADFDTPLPYTLVETDINTGVFTTELDMADILDSSGTSGSIDDGDRIEVTINDRFDDVSREASDELAIGKATTAVDFSRTVVPIPPADDSEWIDADVGIDTTSFTTVIITDSDQNIQSSNEDSFPFVFELDGPSNDTEVFFTVELTTGSGDDFTFDEFEDYDGSILEDILPDLADNPLTANVTEGITLSETGSSTGVFDTELEFVEGDVGLNDWQDLEITINYIDADGDEESGGITARGNDGTVTVDKDSVKSGDSVTVTVQDEDLNLDDDTVEEFSSSIAPATLFVLLIETEDDEIDGGVTEEQFRETGPDTGVFTASFLVGTDIQVTDDSEDEIIQATNILVTYNDDVDATGSSGDELEINLPVVTGTGAIEIMPELVGPGTTVTVLITDTDLDQDSRGTENYDTTDPDGDDFFVSFRSDRDEVGDGSPDIEETGPNTGVFEFEIELITEEQACQDDDLDDPKFEAEGGSNPSVGACPGDLIAVRYEDEQDASGRSTAVSGLIEVKSFDPEFATDKPAYLVGERVTGTISDPDANRDPDIADSLSDLRVTSNSDRVGEDISAIETGRSTGVFKFSFSTSSGTEGGTITVKTGDIVSIEYTDDFPADFEEQEEDKDFVFNVQIGPGASDTTITAAAPGLVDTAGRPIDEPSVGSPTNVATSLVNNGDGDQPFVAILEVRNAGGVTIMLATVGSTLTGNGQASVSSSWTPSQPGDYTLRTFAVSNLNNPVILSKVSESTITVVA